MVPEFRVNVGVDLGKVPKAFQFGAALEVTLVVEEHEPEAVRFRIDSTSHPFNGIQELDELAQR